MSHFGPISSLEGKQISNRYTGMGLPSRAMARPERLGGLCGAGNRPRARRRRQDTRMAGWLAEQQRPVRRDPRPPHSTVLARGPGAAAWFS